jgi:hypothetical protein
MPTEQRVRLAKLLADAGVVPIVDETVAELNFGESDPALPFAAVSDDVVCVGSMSKVLWGGFRVGWLRCPPRLVDAVRRQSESLSLGPSALDQLVATTYLENPARSTRRSSTGCAEPVRPGRRLSRTACPTGRSPLRQAARAVDHAPARLSTELALAARSHGSPWRRAPGSRPTARTPTGSGCR